MIPGVVGTFQGCNGYEGLASPDKSLHKNKKIDFEPIK